MIRPEDEPKINQMTVALRLSKGSACILLVSFNDELLRRDVEAELRRRLEPEGFNFREYRVTEDAYRNLPIMLVDMKPQPGDIFLILDLKKAMPEVLEYLNYRREDFVEHNISAIFWLDEPTLIEIARKAPDFWAFRSLPVFEFSVDRSRDMVIHGRTTLRETLTYGSVEELDAKIALRGELLKDYLEKRPGDRLTIATLYDALGSLYFSKSLFREAMAYYRRALEIYTETEYRRGEAGVLNNMGSVYRLRGDLDEALGYYSQVLEMDRRIGDVLSEASALGNMGNVYQDKGDLDKALAYYSQALELDRRIGNVQGEASTLGNIGNVYLGKGDFDKALEYYLQAQEIDRRIGDVRGEANRLGNMGSAYYGKGDLDKALAYYSQALEIRRRIGAVLSEASALGNIGAVYVTKGDLRTALDYSKKAFRIFMSIGAAMSADKAYRNLQNLIGQMETTGIELSEEDRKEIAELTEEYEKLKGEAASVRTP